MAAQHTILLVGESNVGKTHYGAQFLKRLMVKACALKMTGAPTNLEAFTTALSCLTEGKATDHTPANIYVESVWPITDEAGRYAELVWPDYGGEQVRNLVTQRRIPAAWRDRVVDATDWVVLISDCIRFGQKTTCSRARCSHSLQLSTKARRRHTSCQIKQGQWSSFNAALPGAVPFGPAASQTSLNHLAELLG